MKKTFVTLGLVRLGTAPYGSRSGGAWTICPSLCAARESLWIPQVSL